MLSKKERVELERVLEWEQKYIEKNTNGILQKTGKLISKPIGEISKYANDKIPKEISLKITKAVETAVVGCMDVGQGVVKYTYDKDKAVKYFKSQGINSLEDLYKIEVTNLDKLANNVVVENKIAGFVEGFALGLGEIGAAIADIPLFFTLTFRVMQQIAAIYGYDPEDPKEKLFMIKLLSFGTALETSGKLALQAELQAIKIGIKRYTFKQLQEMGGRYSVVITARKIAKDVGARLTRDTLLKGIPLLGGVFGGFFNYGFIKKIADVANMMYKKRFLEDKKEKGFGEDIIDIEIN